MTETCTFCVEVLTQAMAQRAPRAVELRRPRAMLKSLLRTLAEKGELITVDEPRGADQVMDAVQDVGLRLEMRGIDEAKEEKRGAAKERGAEGATPDFHAVVIGGG